METLAAAAAWRHVVAGRRGATCDVRRGDREFGVLPLLAKHFFQTRWRGVESAPIIRQVDDGSRDFQKPAPTSSRQFSCARPAVRGPRGMPKAAGKRKKGKKKPVEPEPEEEDDDVRNCPPRRATSTPAAERPARAQTATRFAMRARPLSGPWERVPPRWWRGWRLRRSRW
jgi:hypothetical protein